MQGCLGVEEDFSPGFASGVDGLVDEAGFYGEG